MKFNRVGSATNLKQRGTYDLLMVKVAGSYPEGQLSFGLYDVPMKITGIQKVAQHFLKVLMSSKGSDPFYPERGTLFPGLHVGSNITSNNAELMNDLREAVSDASQQVRIMLNNEGTDLESTLDSVEVSGIDVTDEGWFLALYLVTMAGAGAEVSVPFPEFGLISDPLPTAEFTAFPTTGSAPLDVSFVNRSQGNPTFYEWDFQNDGILDSTSKNPTYTFNNPGSYSVKLKVTNAYGSDAVIYNSIIQVTNPVDPYFANVVLLNNLNDFSHPTAILDTSNRNHTMTVTGDSSVHSSSMIGGASLYLDGSGDWVQTTTGLSDFAFGTGDFTVECIAKTTGTRPVLIDFYQTGNAGSWQLVIGYTVNSKLQWVSSDATAVVIASGTMSVSDGLPHHLTASRVSGVLRLFVDGILDAVVVDTRNYTGGASALAIGAQVTSRNPTYDMAGDVCQVRITKGIGRYVLPFIPPEAPFISSDGSYVPPLPVTLSVYSSIQANLSSAVNVSTPSYSLSVLGSTQPNLSSASYVVQTSNLIVSSSTQSNTSSAVSLPATVNLVVANSTEANLSAAVSLGSINNLTVANSTEANLSSTGAVTQISNLTVSSSAQANTASTGAISIPTDASFASVVFLAHLTDYAHPSSILDTSSRARTMTINGAATIQSVPTMIGGGALYTSNIGDYLTTTTSLTDFAFGTGDFTVEGFLKTTKATFVFVDFYNTTNAGGWQIWINAGKTEWWSSTGSGGVKILGGTVVINDGNIHHIAVSRTSGVTKIFVDGVADGSVADTRNYSGGVTPFAIGAQVSSRNTSYDFVGNINQVRITNGVGRYTTGFSVPTSPFPNS
jgi:PKD repeat protein